jgi:predicted regulator of Ras-like GTPase activity (Roadblock/LC7/MglB family)
MLEFTWLVMCLLAARMFASISRFFKGPASKRKEPAQSPFAAPPGREAVQTSLPPPEARAGGQFRRAEEGKEASLSTEEPIEVPLAVILRELPREFAGMLASGGAAGGRIALPKALVLDQITLGAVKISFGEIRRLAPEGTFIKSGSQDQELVALPLKEILKQLKPDEYARRPNQHPIQIPENVSDLFGPNGERLTEVRIMNKEDLREAGTGTKPPFGIVAKGTPAATPSPASSAQPAPPLSSGSLSGSSRPVSRPAPPPVSAPPLSKEHASSAPSAIAVPEALRMAMMGNTAAPSPSAVTEMPGNPAVNQSSESPAPQDTSVIRIPLAQISAQWPDSIRQEIQDQKLADVCCDFPADIIREGLKQGKIEFAWGQMISWLESAPAEFDSSPHGELVLPLPLSVMAPLFLRQAVLPKSKTFQSPRDIPDLFASKKAAETSLPPSSERSSQTQLKHRTAATQAPSASPSALGPLKVSLAAVSAKWPTPVLREVEQLGLSEAEIEIPSETLAQDLKTGKLEFGWNQVCGWVVGFPADASISPVADARLEFPLNVIAPLYFQHRSAATAKKANVPGDIPDLFSSSGVPISPPPSAPGSSAGGGSETAPSAPPSPTSGPRGRSSPPSATVQPPAEKPESPSTGVAPPPKPVVKKPPKNIAELFGESKKRNWTPNEIVHRTSQLPGVSGALIALQDGLLVASCLPPGWKTETIAAFIPQIFGRMGQYTRELAIGDLKSLTLFVDKGPLQIFNAGLIYFLVLGNSDAPIPMNEISIIANELSRHTK